MSRLPGLWEGTLFCLSFLRERKEALPLQVTSQKCSGKENFVCLATQLWGNDWQSLETLFSGFFISYGLNRPKPHGVRWHVALPGTPQHLGSGGGMLKHSWWPMGIFSTFRKDETVSHTIHSP